MGAPIRITPYTRAQAAEKLAHNMRNHLKGAECVEADALDAWLIKYWSRAQTLAHIIHDAHVKEQREKESTNAVDESYVRLVEA